MPLYRATIEILVSADSESEAADLVAETLRPQVKAYGGEFLEDWQYLFEREVYYSPSLVSVESAKHQFSEYEPD